MPEIDLIQPVYYSPLMPYFWSYDNLPIQAIIEPVKTSSMMLLTLIQTFFEERLAQPVLLRFV